MVDITKLADKFRESAALSHGTIQRETFQTCAALVEAALSTHTLITEDKATWPQNGLFYYRHPADTGWSDLKSGRWGEYATTPTFNRAWLGCVWWSPRDVCPPPKVAPEQTP